MRVSLVIITSADQRCSLFQPSIIRFTLVPIYKKNDSFVSGDRKQIFTNKANGTKWVQTLILGRMMADSPGKSWKLVSSKTVQSSDLGSRVE